MGVGVGEGGKIELDGVRGSCEVDDDTDVGVSPGVELEEGVGVGLSPGVDTEVELEEYQKLTFHSCCHTRHGTLTLRYQLAFRAGGLRF